jgi:hypothetical protein
MLLALDVLLPARGGVLMPGGGLVLSFRVVHGYSYQR